jgi:uncharacterized protein (DUF58 family)
MRSDFRVSAFAMTNALEISYRPRWRTEGTLVGAHRSRSAGGQGVLLDQVSFLQRPDPRRIDMRLSLRDPFEGLYVRRFEERLAIAVYSVIDLSLSMQFEGVARKMALAMELCACLARSAYAFGDVFGVIGCDERVRADFFLPAARRRRLEIEITRRFEDFAPERPSTEGLLHAAAYLTGKRKLVFLISDFRMPLAQLEAVLRSLARHDVVPILVSDSAETSALPAWGLIEVQDLETGASRIVLMRPNLRRRWLAQTAAWRQSLDRLFLRYARPPFELIDKFDADKLSRHLLET